MNDSLLMHVVESSAHLVYVVPDLGLIEMTVLLYGSSDDQLEVATFSPLHCYVELIILDEGIKVTNDVWMV